MRPAHAAESHVGISSRRDAGDVRAVLAGFPLVDKGTRRTRSQAELLGLSIRTR